MKKRAILFGLTLLMASSAFSCGSTEPTEEVSSSETATANEVTSNESTVTTISKSDLEKMKYVRAKKKEIANKTANELYHAIFFYLKDNFAASNVDMIYGNTANDKFGRAIANRAELEKDIDYIVFLNNATNSPETVIVRYSDNSKYIGVLSVDDDVDTEELSKLKWSEVLDMYGLTDGEYTKYEMNELDGHTSMKYDDDSQEFGLSNTDADDATLLSLILYNEFNNNMDIKLYKYGKWDKDMQFTEDYGFNVPEHGDIEYIAEFGVGFDFVGRVICHDCSSDEYSVGDTDQGFSYNSVKGKSWDEVVEGRGFTKGEYVEY